MQASDLPARLLARVTLKGEVEQVQGPERDAVASLHMHLHGDVSHAPSSVLHTASQKPGSFPRALLTPAPLQQTANCTPSN